MITREEIQRKERENEERMILELCRKTEEYAIEQAHAHHLNLKIAQTKKLNMYQKIKSTKNKKLCESVFNEYPCRHGSRCNFAHSVEQLNKSYCTHGDYCNYIKKKDDTTYYNINNYKPCIYFHENESNLSYANRMGVKKREYKVPYDILEEVLQLFSLKGIKHFNITCMKKDENVVKVPNEIFIETLELLQKKCLNFNIECI